MDNAFQWLHVSGLLIALVLATMIFIRSIKLIMKRQYHLVRLGIELTVSFSLLYLATGPALSYTNLSEYSGSISKVIAFFWWISLAFTINTSLNEYLWKRLLVDDEVRRVPKILTDGISLVIYAIAIMIVMHYVYEKPITIILASSGAAAFVLGLAAQPTVQEIFAGLSLNTTKALRMGDYVEIDGIYGEVYDINWRSVSVKNPHTGSLYIFPNSAVAGKTILNFNEPNDLFKYWIIFYLDFHSSPELAMRTIAETLEHSRYVMRDPKPDFNMLGFTTKGFEIRVRFYFEGDDPWWDAQNEICMAIWSSLRRKGIRLAIERWRLGCGDEFDINPWVSPKASIPDEDLPQRIATHQLFETFDLDELTSLVQKGKVLDYTPPDCVYLDNTANDNCLYIIEGILIAYEVLDNGDEAPVAKYEAGDLACLDSLSKEKSLHKHKLQADCYTVVCHLDAADLGQLIESNDPAKSYLEKSIDEQNQSIVKNREEYLLEAKSSTYLAKHADLHTELRRHLDELFEKPVLHKIFHLISPSTREKDLLEAIIAAAALMAHARGAVDEIEIDYLRQSLGKLELAKHTDLSECIDHFKKFTDSLANEPDLGSEAIKHKLKLVSEEPRLGKIVMGSALGMSKIHEKTVKAEQDQIEEIANILGMPSNIDEMISQLGD